LLNPTTYLLNGAALQTVSELSNNALPGYVLMQLNVPGPSHPRKCSAEYFTGTVRIDPLNSAAEARVSCASVTFEPRARSAWHTHPLGQTLIVTAGCGWTQCEGEPIVEIRRAM
jgi:quercetin dioxygenase-like cupin family protein